MSASNAPAVPVWPYVLVWAMVKLIYCGVVLIGLYFPDFAFNQEWVNSNLLNILAFGAALAWYGYKIDRPMQLREMILFSSGAVLVDAILSAVVFIGFLLSEGVEISSQGIGSAFGVDDAFDMMIIGVVIGCMAIFVQGMFFAWIFTRKLPRHGKTG
jgi:hypothetical protein